MFTVEEEDTMMAPADDSTDAAAMLLSLSREDAVMAPADGSTDAAAMLAIVETPRCSKEPRARYRGERAPFNLTSRVMDGAEAPYYYETVDWDKSRKNKRRIENKWKYKDEEQWPRVVFPVAVFDWMYKCSICGLVAEGKNIKNHYTDCKDFHDHSTMHAKQQNEMEKYESTVQKKFRTRWVTSG